MDCQSATPIHQLGKYAIYRILREKSGSAVYQGFCTRTQQSFAIKVLTQPKLSDNACVRRFLKEAQILTQLSHPNIVKLHQFGKYTEGYYIALEYVPGISLREYILSQWISLFQAVDHVLSLGHALEYLHSRGILHGDIKPENILITPQGKITLIDLGLAGSPALHDNGYPGCLGTPFYMSPEQKQGENISEQSEIYSLGLIAYELLLGNLAYGRVLLSLIPEKIGKILSKTLQPSPKDRYDSITDFLNDLRAYRYGDDIHKDKRQKDLVATTYGELIQQRLWLSPWEIPTPDYVSASLHEQGYPALPYVYHEAFVSAEMFKLWFYYSPSRKDTLALTLIKGFINQWGHEDNPRVVIRKIHKECIRLHTPIDTSGISVICVSIPKEKQELSWTSCGKTIFWLKKQKKVPQNFITTSMGVGKICSLQIQETKVAWEIGDEAILHTLQADSPKPSLYCPLSTELKDRRQTAIFCPIESVQYGIIEECDGTLYPSTLISLKRIR
ncbi:serine/threonine protein kinase [Chlamydia avium]|uniref:Phosphotransferase enzyme family protein n=1 Tax=Chlamydia avium TaxID=1457141 RepID=A0ABN0MTA3_9CHLA|nr:serine/threonine-protein kinase [Chlamydia avium]EPP36264.1 phosphotransferase enzyme family protein [Chlamydia psittaci 10_743_SC13]EPP38694.1 phosphotransferase enzyme family protein [Chlamydia avium]